MFNKRPDSEEPAYEKIEPTPPTSADVKKRKVSVIGPTLKFSGELSANEDLIIEGEIHGTIAHQDKHLTVGQSGRVVADIDAKTIEIYGTVDGDVRGEDLVKLAKSAKVNGNIYCGRIVMEDGATFSGHIDMSGRQQARQQTLAIAEQIDKAESAG